jgi:hypothetical protein
MKLTHSIYLTVVVIVLTACAAPVLPAFVTAPEPPLEWNVLLEKKVGCPDATGEYELTPTVAILQNDREWSFSIGKWYDYLMLIPFDRVTADKSTRGGNSLAYSPGSLLFESNEEGDKLWIVSPYRNSEKFMTHLFSEAENDYKCQVGNLVFPESKIQGGTEGAYLNGKIYRQATITSAGDLLFYEQVQSHKTIHRYYLFKRKNSKNSLG